MTDYRKKLIEVALPLEAINKACQAEKSNPFLCDHPRRLHLYFARRPLAACRAILFASLVDDPSSHPEHFPTEETQEKERQRLFGIIEDLVKWENTTNEHVLERARKEILKSTGGNPPPVLDPFCGGGSIPLEAQRLGLEAHASDLNPVAVLITKALIEIPPKFAGRPPVNPESRKKLDHSKTWHRAQGLAEDVRYYGKWMRDEAEKRIGHLYPKVKLPKEQGGGEATVIAWLWARTVKCPNPACGAQMPLVRSFWLSTKAGKKAWIEPVIDKKHKTVQFEVRTGSGSPPDGTVNRRGATCVFCSIAVSFEHIRSEGRAGRVRVQLIAIVAEGQRARAYLPPMSGHEVAAGSAIPSTVPDTSLPERALSFRVQLYGMTKHRDLFTARQLLAISTLCELIHEVRNRVQQDAVAAGWIDNRIPLRQGAAGATAYAEAIASYLDIARSRSTEFHNSLASWNCGPQNFRQLFTRQALPMVWDFAEANMFGGLVPYDVFVEYVASSIEGLPTNKQGSVRQMDAASPEGISTNLKFLVVTDPPYYDNIGYADLMDFFYVWMRGSLRDTWPDLFRTLLTPKAEELVATPFRFSEDKEAAKMHFEEGLRKAFCFLKEKAHHNFPITVYYAFKQAEEDDTNDDLSTIIISTGWETMLASLLNSGLTVDGTWPMRTERPSGVKVSVNALASSIALVCRPRPREAPLATRRELLTALKNELPAALKNLQRGNIAPVDLAQAAIGPGMAVFSRYSKVVEADGSPMTVRTALGLINQTLDEVFAEQEGEFDADTRWAVAWFEQFGMQEGAFGVAETLSKAKNTAVQGMVEAGILSAKAGKVRLLKRDELSDDWDPATDRRLTIWEVSQYLIRALEQHGESGAAELLRKLGSLGEVARDLAYRLYNICERKKWSQEALAYNSLVISWPEITRLARVEKPKEEQTRLGL
jgi:putative DNA methylase